MVIKNNSTDKIKEILIFQLVTLQSNVMEVVSNKLHFQLT